MQAGANVDATNAFGHTALPIAVTVRREADTVRRAVGAARLLIEPGATVDAQDNGGRMTLHLCASRQQHGFEAITALLGCGANANARNPSGNVPLQLVAAHALFIEDAVKAFDLLLRWGADETAVNDEDRTPLEEAGDMFDIGDFGRLSDLATRALADRSWRRRAWFLLYRAYPRRMRPSPGTGAAPSDRAGKCRARSVWTEAASGESVAHGMAAGTVARRGRTA